MVMEEGREGEREEGRKGGRDGGREEGRDSYRICKMGVYIFQREGVNFLMI